MRTVRKTKWHVYVRGAARRLEVSSRDGRPSRALRTPLQKLARVMEPNSSAPRTADPGLVEKIAGIAAREVPGINALGGGSPCTVGAVRDRVPGGRPRPAGRVCAARGRSGDQVVLRRSGDAPESRCRVPAASPAPRSAGREGAVDGGCAGPGATAVPFTVCRRVSARVGACRIHAGRLVVGPPARRRTESRTGVDPRMRPTLSTRAGAHAQGHGGTWRAVRPQLVSGQGLRRGPRPACHGDGAGRPSRDPRVPPRQGGDTTAVRVP
jgi:hypothetical protein